MASINKEVLKIEIKIFHVTISMKCWCQISVRFTMDRLWFSCCPLSEDGPLFYPIKGIVSRLCALVSSFFFLQKTIELSYSLDKIFFPDRTVDGDLLFIFSSNILDFRRSLSSYLKFGEWHEDSSRFYR